MTQKRTHWQSLLENVRTVADRWDPDHITLDTETLRDAHVSMASTVIRHSLQLNGTTWPESWDRELRSIESHGSSDGVLRDGFTVFALHALNVSYLAGASELSYDKLPELLHDPSTIAPILELTCLQGCEAGRVEVEHGISKFNSYSPNLLIDLGRYSLRDGKLVLPRFRYEILSAIGGHDEEGVSVEIPTKSRCHAVGANIFSELNASVVNIALKDPRLAYAAHEAGKEYKK